MNQFGKFTSDCYLVNKNVNTIAVVVTNERIIVFIVFLRGNNIKVSIIKLKV